MSLVIDASITIAWLFEDEHTDATHKILDRVIAEGAVVPGLWRLEVANVLRNAVRRRRCDETYVNHSLARLNRLPILTDEDAVRHAWGATLALSRQEQLTIYDAAYLELALRRRAPLATCDAALLAAAKRLRVEILAT